MINRLLLQIAPKKRISETTTTTTINHQQQTTTNHHPEQQQQQHPKQQTGNRIEKHQIVKVGDFAPLPLLRHVRVFEQLAG